MLRVLITFLAVSLVRPTRWSASPRICGQFGPLLADPNATITLRFKHGTAVAAAVVLALQKLPAVAAAFECSKKKPHSALIKASVDRALFYLELERRPAMGGLPMSFSQSSPVVCLLSGAYGACGCVCGSYTEQEKHRFT